MISVNFVNHLHWKQPADLRGDVMYIVQYKMDVAANKDDYKTICVTHEQHCDSSSITYRSYVRVKTRIYPNDSDWVQIHFDPYEQTIIRAPNVTVSSRSGYLDVSFKGPLMGPERGSVKEKYGDAMYRVEYWKESDPAHVLYTSTSHSQYTLQNLETWTMYCVRVQAYAPEFEKGGEFSPVMCKETHDDGRTPSWKIAVLFLGSMVLAAVITLLLICLTVKGYQITRYIFFPSYSIPEHLKEYLSNPFSNAPYLPPQPPEECGESCEQLTFVSEMTEEKEEA
ncbi:interleukin-10 receptor subunit beta isoform X2 [Dendropsophus ebraccatus]